MTSVPADLDPTGRVLTVGAMCKPSAPDGVIVSMGDAREGFSLYLQGGVPHFAVRSGGALHTARAPEAVTLDQWVHLAGIIGAEGEISLLVNTWPVASAPGTAIAHTPVEPLTIGADPGLPVGGYASPAQWTGLIQAVRLYWGAATRDTARDALGDWADRPGCGCRK